MLASFSPHLELILRLSVGTALGAFIGYERDLHGRPAGLRTHALVALASATFMVVSTQFVFFQHYTHQDLVAVDPSRIAASVVSGIGFLAGGAILRTGISIQGLTTAAGLWLVAAIGLAAGSGMYIESLFVTCLGVLALTVLRRFEDKNDSLIALRIQIVMTEAFAPVSPIVACLKDMGATILHQDHERPGAGNPLRLAFDVRLPGVVSIDELVNALEGLPSVGSLRIEH